MHGHRTEHAFALQQVSAADDDAGAAAAMETDAAAHLDGSSATAPAGHVTVCGVELRTRPGASPAPPAQPLVMTPTVRRNVKSLALALCGVRGNASVCLFCSLSVWGCPAPVDSNTKNTERHKAS